MAKQPAQFTSARQLATAIGVTHTAVNEWLKDERWTFPRKGPWPATLLPKIQAWRDANLADDPAAEETPSATAGLGIEKKARIAFTLEKTKLSKLNREIKQGLYHPVADCQRQRIRQIHAVKQEFVGIAEKLKPQIGDAAAALVAAEIDRVCRAFAAGN